MYHIITQSFLDGSVKAGFIEKPREGIVKAKVLTKVEIFRLGKFS
jgi:hypothetical protein